MFQEGKIAVGEWITSLPYWIDSSAQCCQLYHPLENESFDRLFKHVRELHNARCIPMQESIRKIIDLQRKHQTVVVGYIADQVPMWNNIHHWVDFLNHDTPVLTGTERIIRHMDQACFYGDLRRVGRGHYFCRMQLISRHPKDCAQCGAPLYRKFGIVRNTLLCRYTVAYGLCELAPL